MKVYYSPASPFVRKVLVSAHELGLADRIELLSCAAHPINRDQEIVAHNPLGQVPTFFTDDGSVIYDSRVICEYLDSFSPGRLLGSGESRWRALTEQSLADGLLDAALLARYETAVQAARVALGFLDAIPAGEGEFRPRSAGCLGSTLCGSRRYRHHHRRMRLGLSRFPVSRSRLARLATATFAVVC